MDGTTETDCQYELQFTEMIIFPNTQWSPGRQRTERERERQRAFSIPYNRFLLRFQTEQTGRVHPPRCTRKIVAREHTHLTRQYNIYLSPIPFARALSFQDGMDIYVFTERHKIIIIINRVLARASLRRGIHQT